jgi:hypothetical protein
MKEIVLGGLKIILGRWSRSDYDLVRVNDDCEEYDINPPRWFSYRDEGEWYAEFFRFYVSIEKEKPKPWSVVPRYLAKAVASLDGAPLGTYHMEIQHDPGCPALEGMACRCDPAVKRTQGEIRQSG